MAREIAQHSLCIIETVADDGSPLYTLLFSAFIPRFPSRIEEICKHSGDQFFETFLGSKIKDFYTEKTEVSFPANKVDMVPSMKTNYDILTLGHFTFLLYNLFEQYINMHLNYLVYEDLHRLLFAIILLRAKPVVYEIFKAVICKELNINFCISQQKQLDGNASALSQQMQLGGNASSFNFCDISVIPHSNETSLSLANYLEPGDVIIGELCILLLSGVIFLSEIIKSVKTYDIIFKLEFKHWIEILKRKGFLPQFAVVYDEGIPGKAHKFADIKFKEARDKALELLSSQSYQNIMYAINQNTIAFHRIFEEYFVDVQDREKKARTSRKRLICAWYNSLIDDIFKQALIPGVRFVKKRADITKQATKHLCILDMVDVYGHHTTKPKKSNSTKHDTDVKEIFKTLRSNDGHGRGHKGLELFYSNTSTEAVVHARTTVIFEVLNVNIKKHTGGTLLAKIAKEYKKTSSNYESIAELLELFRIDFSTIVENLIKSIILFIFREDYCGNEEINKQQRQFILKLLENYLTLFYHVDTLVYNIIAELNKIITDLKKNILNHIYKKDIDDVSSSDDVSKRQVMTAKIIDTYKEKKEAFEDKLVRVYKETFSCKKKETLRIILKPLFDALKVCDVYLNFISEPTSLEAKFSELLFAFDVLKAQIELITIALKSIQNSFSTDAEKQLIAELVVKNFNEILAVFKLGDMAGKLEKLAQECKSAVPTGPTGSTFHNQGTAESVLGEDNDTAMGKSDGGGNLTIKKMKNLAIKGGGPLKEVVLEIIKGMRMNKDGDGMMNEDGSRQVISLKGVPNVANAATCVVIMNRKEKETQAKITQLLKENAINNQENINKIIKSIYDSSKMCDDEGKESKRIQDIIEEFKPDEAEAAKINEAIKVMLLLDYKYNYNFLGQKLENSKKLCRANFDELTKYDEGGTRSVDNTIFHDDEAFTTEFSDMKEYAVEQRAMDEDRPEGQGAMDEDRPRKRKERDPTPPRLQLRGPLSALGGKLLNKMGLINKATSILAKPKTKPKITKTSLEKQTQKNNEILAKPKSKPKITKASLEKQTQKNNEILAKPKITKGSLETQTQKNNEILAKPKPKSKITKASLEKQTQKDNEILDKPKPKSKITKGSLEKQTQKNIEILDKPKPKTKITKVSLEKQTQKDNEILDKPKPKTKITKGSLEKQTQKDNEILAKPKTKITKASLEKQTQKDNEILAKPKPKPKTKPKPKITK